MSPAPGMSTAEEPVNVFNVSALEKFRIAASFNWEKMRLNIEDPEQLAVKWRVWRMLEQSKVFERQPALLSDDDKRITARQLVEFHQSGIFNNIHTQCYKERTRYIMTVNEATNMYSPSLSVKFALGVSLFANAILSLGTERHKKFYNDVWEGKILSCLALTELAHGSDTKRLRTTATYDCSTQEFVIHTPDYLAAKCWVGNLGKQCTHAMVFAQLWASETCHGLHAFIVPVRNPSTLLPYSGLTIGDIGEKAGLHGIDNGFIMFNMYRIPRENLLNRIGDVTLDGEYETSFTDPQRILGYLSYAPKVEPLEDRSCPLFTCWLPILQTLTAGLTESLPSLLQESLEGSEEKKHLIRAKTGLCFLLVGLDRSGAALENLSAGRVAIMQESSNTLACAVTIAVRYAALRMQFCDVSGQELPLLSYQLHQWRLFKHLAAAYVLKVFVQDFSNQYLDCVVHSNNGSDDMKMLSNIVSGVHAIVCCSKPLMTWAARDAIQEAREACGGNGYLKAAGLGDLRNNHDPTVTYEGDNNVLLQQTSNWLLRQSKELSAVSEQLYFPLSCIQYLATPAVQAHYSGQHVCSHNFVVEAFDWLVTWLLSTTEHKVDSLMAQTDKLTARNVSQVFYAHTLSLAFAENNVLKYFWHHCECSEEVLRAVLEKLYYLYALTCLQKHLSCLYQGGYCEGPQLAQNLNSAVLQLCADLQPEAVSLVEALSPPDFILNSVIARADGKLYENLIEYFMSQPGAMERPSWWREIRPRSKL